MNKPVKKLGVGSTSLILFIIGILFSFSFKNKICYGDSILTYLGLKAWSNDISGTHYTVFYSLIFFIPSIIIGYKFKNDLGARLGKILSLVITIIILISIIFLIKI